MQGFSQAAQAGHMGGGVEFVSSATKAHALPFRASSLSGWLGPPHSSLTLCCVYTGQLPGSSQTHRIPLCGVGGGHCPGIFLVSTLCRAVTPTQVGSWAGHLPSP